MRNFFETNYYKLFTSISLLFFSLSLFVFSISKLNANNIESEKKPILINPGEEHVTGVGIQDDYAYIIDYRIDGRNYYYKVPLNRFKYSSDTGTN